MERPIKQIDVIDEVEQITYNKIKEFKKEFSENENITTSLYGESLIKKSNIDLKEKYQNFYDDVYKIQKHKFRFPGCFF